MDAGFLKWLREGVENGYCSDVYCENHDGVHNDDFEKYEEYQVAADGRDFCWPIVRVYHGVEG